MMLITVITMMMIKVMTLTKRQFVPLTLNLGRMWNQFGFVLYVC